MEHSPYSQSPSPSSSLVNFPTPTSLPDIRLHRPFSQMHDLKHLHIPFNMRFMENYPALPAHLLHHLQPPFLHPALDPRVSFSPAGVFQPLGSPSPHHQHPHHQHHSHHAAAAAAASLKGFTSAGTHHHRHHQPTDFCSAPEELFRTHIGYPTGTICRECISRGVAILFSYFQQRFVIIQFPNTVPVPVAFLLDVAQSAFD
ncbi:hypothetical protein ACI65C_006102 [Semiaphis heraclei]